MATSNITSELYNLITENDYKTEFVHLNEEDSVQPNVLKALKKDSSETRCYDTSRFQTRNGNIIPDGVYTLFTKYAGEDSTEIRDRLSTWVYEHRSELLVLTEHSFDGLNENENFKTWSLMINMKKRPGNELTLFCLCKMYHRHATVYTTNGYWTTLKADSSETDVCAKSDIILLYLGKNKFCEITDKGATECSITKTKRKRVTKSLSELVQSERAKQEKADKKSTRVQLNLTKHDHNTRGSTRKQHNIHPVRTSTASVSYVPDITSSDESEPSIKKQRRSNLNYASPTRPSGPSETRIRAQEIITRNRLQTRQNVHTKIIETLIVSPKAKIKQESGYKVKLEIKEEHSKPLTKKQKERRRRRKLREMREYEWDHVHYKMGKGLLCCEHAKGKKKATDDNKNETEPDQTVNTDNVTESTNVTTIQPQDNGLNHENPSSSEIMNTNSDIVNAENAVELNNANVNQRRANELDNEDTLNSDRTDIIPNTGIGTLSVNTDNAEEDTHATLLNCEHETETGDLMSNINTVNAAVDYGAETEFDSTNTDIEPPVNTENNKETRSKTDPANYREKDAIDALLLLSRSEDTMDEFELTKDNTQQDNQIEFNQEVDMESLMTALHIDSASTNVTNDTTSKKTTKRRKKKSTNKPKNKTSKPKPR